MVLLVPESGRARELATGGVAGTVKSPSRFADDDDDAADANDEEGVSPLRPSADNTVGCDMGSELFNATPARRSVVIRRIQAPERMQKGKCYACCFGRLVRLVRLFFSVSGFREEAGWIIVVRLSGERESGGRPFLWFAVASRGAAALMQFGEANASSGRVEFWDLLKNSVDIL
jgi:hypothetical protein